MIYIRIKSTFRTQVYLVKTNKVQVGAVEIGSIWLIKVVEELDEGFYSLPCGQDIRYDY